MWQPEPQEEKKKAKPHVLMKENIVFVWLLFSALSFWATFLVQNTRIYDRQFFCCPCRSPSCRTKNEPVRRFRAGQPTHNLSLPSNRKTKGCKTFSLAWKLFLKKVCENRKKLFCFCQKVQNPLPKKVWEEERPQNFSNEILFSLRFSILFFSNNLFLFPPIKTDDNRLSC